MIISKEDFLSPEPVCPICSSPIFPWGSKHSEGMHYQIHRCNSCSYAFINPRPSLASLKKWYAQSGHHTTESNIDQEISLATILARENEEPNSVIDAKRMVCTIRRLAQNKDQLRLLDVGCGYGFFSKEAIRQGFLVVALELATQERAIASEMLGIEPIPTSFEDFDSPPPARYEFDVVLMSQILEHACDINLWIDKVNGLLCRGGVLAIALPNFNSFLRYFLKEKEPYITPPAHLNFFSPKSLAMLLEKHGFQVNAIQHVSRIPRSTLEKRLKPAVLANLSMFTVPTLLRIVDTVGYGMIINVYARKK